MWPERRPGRGSGALPAKRSAERASTICALSSVERHAHVAQGGDGADIHLGGELSRRPRGVAVLQRPASRLSISAGRRRGCRRSWRRTAGTSTTPAAPKTARRCHRRRRCRRRRCRARRPPRRIASGRAACAAGRSNDRLTASMSKNTAPGMWPSRYSAMGVALLRRQEIRAVDHARGRDRASARRATRSTPASGLSGEGASVLSGLQHGGHQFRTTRRADRDVQA